MNLTRMYAVFLRQMYIIRNLPSRVVPYFIYAFLDIVLWGFITVYLNSLGNARFDFIPVLLGAVVLWNFLQRVQQGISIPFLEDIWTRNLINIFASPLRLFEYVSGFIIASIATSTFGLIVMLILAYLFFGFTIVPLGLTAIPFLLLLFLFGIVLGLCAASIVLRYGPYAEWFIWPIPAMLSPFVGVFYPVSTLPEWMQAISLILPPTYVFEGMRSIMLEGEFAPSLLSIGLVLSLAYLILAYGLFAYIYRVVIRKGLIARFSAEAE